MSLLGASLKYQTTYSISWELKFGHISLSILFVVCLPAKSKQNSDSSSLTGIYVWVRSVKCSDDIAFSAYEKQI